MNATKAWLAALLVLWTAPAAAQPATKLKVGGELPWAQGVSVPEQEAARTLFLEGNNLAEESLSRQATQKYREALAHWDHPAFHYNLALALMTLEQPLEVYKHLEAAMRYGPAPLDAQKFAYARTYKELLDKQLVRLEVTCQEPDAEVMLDNKLLFKAPGRFDGLVVAGMHTLVATKPGFERVDKSRPLLPGVKAAIEIKLYPTEQYFRTATLWPTWRPWAVVGAGAVVALGGGLLHLRARNDFLGFDQGITACGGCRPAPELAGMRGQGETLQTVAYGAYAVGGAALAAGAVLLLFNQPRTYRIDPEQQNAPAVSVTPLLGGDVTGALATIHF